MTPNIITSVSLVQLRYVKVSSHENYIKKWCCVKRLKVAQNFGFERGATVTSLSFCFVSTSAVIVLVLTVRAPKVKWATPQFFAVGDSWQTFSQI